MRTIKYFSGAAFAVLLATGAQAQSAPMSSFIQGPSMQGPSMQGVGMQGAGQHAPCWPLAHAGTCAAAKLVVFGDLLSDNGNTAVVEKALGLKPSYLTPPYDSNGDFSDGPKWTTDLAWGLRLTQENFAYEGATAGTLGLTSNQVNPAGGLSPLDTFAGQIKQFEKKDGVFSPDDVVSVTFGGNDIFLASFLSLAGQASSAQVIENSVDAFVAGLRQLRALGARHFLISNSPDLTLSPIFSSAEFQASGATTPAVRSLVQGFNTELAAKVGVFEQQTGADVRSLDLHALFDTIVANPSRYGFDSVTEPVLSSVPGTGTTTTYNPAIDGQDPQVEHKTLFIDPLFDTTERAQLLVAITALRALIH